MRKFYLKRTFLGSVLMVEKSVAIGNKSWGTKWVKASPEDSKNFKMEVDELLCYHKVREHFYAETDE
jgi:hypothetical protein